MTSEDGPAAGDAFHDLHGQAGEGAEEGTGRGRRTRAVGKGLTFVRRWLAEHPGDWQLRVLIALIFTYAVADAWINSGFEQAWPHLAAGILGVIYIPSVLRWRQSRKLDRLDEARERERLAGG